MWVRLKDFHQQHPEVTYYTLCEWSCNDKLGPYLNRKGRLFNENELITIVQRWLWMKTNKAKPGFVRLKTLFVAWLQQYMLHYSKTDEYTEEHKRTMLPRLEEYLDSVGMGSVEIVAREQLRNEYVGGIVNMPADIVVNVDAPAFLDNMANPPGQLLDLRGYSIKAPEVKEQPTGHLSKAKYDFYVGVPQSYSKLDDAGFPTPLNTHVSKEELKRQAILDQCRPVAKSMGAVPVYDSMVDLIAELVDAGQDTPEPLTPTPDIILGAKHPLGTYQLNKGTITASDFALEQKQYGPSIAAFMFALKPMQDKLDALGASVASIKSTIDNMPSHSYLDAKVADLASSVRGLKPDLTDIKTQMVISMGGELNVEKTYKPVCTDHIFSSWLKELEGRLKHIACELVYRNLESYGRDEATLQRIKARSNPHNRSLATTQDRNDNALFNSAYRHFIRLLRRELYEVCGIPSSKYLEAVHLIIYSKYLSDKEKTYKIEPKLKKDIWGNTIDDSVNEKVARQDYLKTVYGSDLAKVVYDAKSKFEAYIAPFIKTADQYYNDPMLTPVIDPLHK